MIKQMHQPYIETGHWDYTEKREDNFITYEFTCNDSIRYIPDCLCEVVWICRGDKTEVWYPDKVHGDVMEAHGSKIFGVRADYGNSLTALNCNRRYTVGQDIHPCACRIIKHIIETRGCISVEEAAAMEKYTSRHIDNIFKDIFGCNTKYFIKTVRFHNALSALIDNPCGNNSEYMEGLDYSDQAHFQREFKAFSGITPGEMKKKYKNPGSSY